MTAAPSIDSGIFRAYDIRGIVGQGLDAQSVRLIGQAIGSEVLEQGSGCLYMAADARLSSPELSRALREGLLAAGCRVVDLGTVPTPLLYFATHAGEHDTGVMLTGSHNPRDYNGLKIVLGRRTLADNQIQRLRERIGLGELRAGQGEYLEQDFVPAYQEAVCNNIRLQRRYRVAIDCGSGVTALVAPKLFDAIGCETTVLCGEADGNFPFHHPDPTRPENLRLLQGCLAESPHDLGIAFDGDGDRVILVTGSGRTIDTDRLLLAFAEDILADEPGASVVFDVKSSYHLPRRVTELGGQPVLCRSGHSYVKQAMLASGALLGGEFSAHIFLRHRWYGFDDGMYAAARFLELMDRRGESADAILDRLPKSVGTPELFAPVPEADKFALMDKLARELRFPGASLNLLDGIRADFPHGWGLVRASNTTPNLVLRFEADDNAALAAIQQSFRTQLLPHLPSLPF